MDKVAGRKSLRSFAVALGVCALLVGSNAVRADEREPGLIAGVDLGVSVPTSHHYNHRAAVGGAALPYVGYMLSDYIGLQFNGLFAFQSLRDHVSRANTTPRLGGTSYDEATGQVLGNPLNGVANQDGSQWTSVIGYLAGPRLEFPFEQWGVPLHINAVAQGGGFTGLSGVLTQTNPGMSFGGGVDYYITDELAVGLFGRWNRILGGASPNGINNTPWSSPPDEGPVDFAVTGISVKMDFREKSAPPPAPAPAPVKKADAAPPPPAKKRIVLRGVNFDFNKYNIRPQDVPILEEAVRTLKAEGLPTVIAIGYTDSVGTDAYNDKLSMQRADSVRSWLVSHGIPRDKIVAEGRGERDPVASNDTADGRAQNRRVELKIRE
jgi:outer membrane protein OmpA-like peptidoglycan-associated protein